MRWHGERKYVRNNPRVETSDVWTGRRGEMNEASAGASAVESPRGVIEGESWTCTNFLRESRPVE